MKKRSIVAAICLLTASIFSSCVEDEKPILPQGGSPVKINEAYSNGGRSTYGSIDWVELYNPSDDEVNVGGFVLSDKADKAEKVSIPANTTIAARGYLVVEVDVEGGFGLSSSGDLVYLYDTDGLIVDEFSFGALEVNEATARVPDGSETLKVQTPTRGASNSGAVAVPSVSDVAHAPTSPTAEEDVTVSATVTAGEGTIASVTLKWKLNAVAQTDIAMTAGSNNTYTAQIARQVVDAAVEYSVVAANSVGGTTTIDGSYTVRDAAVVDYTGLVINEVDGNGKFVELYNLSESTISLAGVKLVKNEEADAADIWWTGGAVSIAAGEYYTIAEEGSTTAGATEATGNSGISPKKNVKFELKTPDDVVLDQFTRSTTFDIDETCTPDYGSGTKYSFARCPDGAGAFGLAVPSCNTANPFIPAGAIVTVEASSKLTDLVINEVDGNGKFIEIYNKGAAPVSLEGLTIIKNLETADDDIWWTGGNTATIQPGAYYTIAEEGSTTTGVTEATGNGGISPKKTVRFDLVIGSMLVDVFARVKADNAIDVNCTPDYGSGTKYSFSRCPDGAGAFGLAVPSCNVANPATAAAAIVTE